MHPPRIELVAVQEVREDLGALQRLMAMSVQWLQWGVPTSVTPADVNHDGIAGVVIGSRAS